MKGEYSAVGGVEELREQRSVLLRIDALGVQLVEERLSEALESVSVEEADQLRPSDHESVPQQSELSLANLTEAVLDGGLHLGSEDGAGYGGAAAGLSPHGEGAVFVFGA